MTKTDLSESSTSVLSAIVRAPEAWCEAAPIESRWPGEIDRLVSAGLVDQWHRPDYEAVTLSPFAAELLEVQIVERWRTHSEVVGRDCHPPCPHVERVAEEIPAWRPVTLALGPIRLPHHAHEVPLAMPERVQDHREPEVLLDGVTGEPIRLWGRTAVVDRRMR